MISVGQVEDGMDGMEERKGYVSVTLDMFHSPEGDWVVAGLFLLAGVAGILALRLGLGWLLFLLVEAPFLLAIATLTIRVGGYRLVDHILLWWSVLAWIWRDGTPYAGRILPPEGGELRFL